MKIRSGLLIHPTPDGLIAVATGDAARHFNGMIRLNETAAFFLRHMAGETTEDALLDAVTQEYDVARETAQRDLTALLARLRAADLLEQ